MSTHLPSKIGKYDVVGLIARGRRGCVFAGQDPDLSVRVAIKTIAAAFVQDADVVAFCMALRPAAGIDHPAIVKIFEAGVHEANPYVVMEYVEGESLDGVQRELSPGEKIGAGIEVCEALACAHGEGIAHLGIDPGKIILCRDGGVKIAGLGIAEALNRTVPRKDAGMGMPRYMAPEQLVSGAADYRADIFSTGVVLYELVCGRVPFEADSPAGSILKIAQEAAPPFSMFGNGFPQDLEPILIRALAKNPQERYETAEDFASDLRRILRQLEEEPWRASMEAEASSPVSDRALEGEALGPAPNADAQDQHSNAIRLLGDVQERMEQPEAGSPVFGLWVQAERALAEGRFAEAQHHAEEALGLDPEDADLKQLRETIRSEAARTEKLQAMLESAKAAQAAGNLDAARKAAEAAMEVSPNHAEAKALYQLISREILERARQRQIENCLKEARQEISSGRFGEAIEVLRRAEELDPNAPGVQSLIQLAQLGQRQERRRAEVEGLKEEIQDALNRADYRGAMAKAEEALTRFPQERALSELKAQAESQLQLAEGQRVVEEELAAARELFEAGRYEELKERLQPALMQLGSEPRLESLLAAASEELQRPGKERQKAEAMRRASEALSRQAYDDAIRILKRAASEGEEDAELHAWLDRAQAERADALKATLLKVEEEPDLNQSKILLRTALLKLPDEKQLREKLTQVTHIDQMVTKNIGEAGRLEEAGQYDLALAKWEMVGVLHPRHPELKNAMRRIRGRQEGARGDARRAWMERIEAALSKSDYAEASELVGKAAQEFPWDSDVMELQDRTEAGIRQRSKAQKLLAEAQKQLSRQQWEGAARTLVRAREAAPEDTVIRRQVVEALRLASREALQQRPKEAEMILQALLAIEPEGAGTVNSSAQGQRPGSDAGAGEAHWEHEEDAGISLSSDSRGIAMPPASNPAAQEGASRPRETVEVPLARAAWASERIVIPDNVLIDNVRFTVTAPGCLPSGSESEIQFWVHGEQQTETVLARAREGHGREGMEQAPLQGGLRAEGCAGLSVRLKLSGGVTCDSGHKWYLWTGEIGNASFRVNVPSEAPEGEMVGVASVRLNGCQIAKLTFLLNIGPEPQAMQSIPCQTMMHRRAFASYATEDREQVVARVRAMEAVYKGLRVYVDSVSLRNATYWEPDLHGRIDATDIFYLFWSRNAIQSDWVTREWRWALRSKGLDFIDPVPLERPEAAPPPVELAGRYFGDPLLAFAGAGV